MSNNTNLGNNNSERKTLVLALIAGVCGDAFLSWITMSEVSFSIFPIIALVLALYCLYQEYLSNPSAEDAPLVSLACFFVGAFGHSAFMKAQYPGTGSNFFAIVVALLLIAFIAKKLKLVARYTEKKSA